MIWKRKQHVLHLWSCIHTLVFLLDKWLKCFSANRQGRLSGGSPVRSGARTRWCCIARRAAGGAVCADAESLQASRAAQLWAPHAPAATSGSASHFTNTHRTLWRISNRLLFNLMLPLTVLHPVQILITNYEIAGNKSNKYYKELNDNF